MTTPTGNRWVNQDTGAIANPDNIQTDLPGHGHKIKYGPLVTDPGEPPPAVPAPVATATADAGAALEAGDIGEPTAPLVVEGEHEVTAEDQSTVVEGRRLGPAVTGKPAKTETEVAAAIAALEQTKLTIREFNRIVTNPKSAKGEKNAADAGLKQLATIEYGRPDGGREPIKRILARYGYGNPRKA